MLQPHTHTHTHTQTTPLLILYRTSSNFTDIFCQNTNKFQKSRGIRVTAPHTHTHTHTHKPGLTRPCLYYTELLQILPTYFVKIPTNFKKKRGGRGVTAPHTHKPHSTRPRLYYTELLPLSIQQLINYYKILQIHRQHWVRKFYQYIFSKYRQISKK